MPLFARPNQFIEALQAWQSPGWMQIRKSLERCNGERGIPAAARIDSELRYKVLPSHALIFLCVIGCFDHQSNEANGQKLTTNRDLLLPLGIPPPEPEFPPRFRLVLQPILRLA